MKGRGGSPLWSGVRGAGSGESAAPLLPLSPPVRGVQRVRDRVGEVGVADVLARREQGALELREGESPSITPLSA